MPKRGNRGGGRGWNSKDNQRFITKNNYFDEHDDRGDTKHINVKRRVSFKPSGSRYGGNRKISNVAIRAQVAEDADMIGNENYESNRGNFRVRGTGHPRRNSPPPRPYQNNRKKLLQGVSGWYIVIIPHGQRYQKDFIIKSLCNAISPGVFIPHYYEVQPKAAVFFVDDFKMAEALKNVDRKIETPDGYRLVVLVRNSTPKSKVDELLKEKMKLAMVKRYTLTTKALDLTKFHLDPELREIFCGLYRPEIMLAAIDVIAENIPDLEALNLADNKICIMDHFKSLSSKLPYLKILHMANNRITNLSALDSLKGLAIVDLVLNGNPVKERIKEQTQYVSEIRKRFPKVVKLDGIDIPPPIGFDIGENTSLPSPKASFLCDSSGAEIVRRFLEQYFIIYDSDSRQPLLDAYHEHAMCSLTVYNNSNKASPYLSSNRNILRVTDLELRLRYLKIGRLPVVSFLSELPLTQHDPQSFGVDLTLFSPRLILLTVTGMFKEVSSSNQFNNRILRSFQRSLVIVPSGSGFCIKNEIIHINNVTDLQERKAFKPLVSQSVHQSNIPSDINDLTLPPQQQIPPQAITTPNSIDENTKIQMVQAMSHESNMNLAWSKKCLEETNWDFQRAGFIFTELHKQNKIPPEAFLQF